MIEISKAPDYAVHAVSAVCYRNRRFLLVKRAKPSHQYWLAFPGGRVEPGETPLKAVARELLEETRLTAATFVHLTTIDLVKNQQRRANFFLSVYAALGVRGQAVAGDDASATYWLSLEEMGNYRIIPSVVEIAQKLIEKPTIFPREVQLLFQETT